ncbi:MAG: AAA family ATPase [Opitutaceae bacterium]|jgi:predicted AAA+ superfamily ATPase|nr:AAA family ATPase [Opitutaceae bacterium]
MIDKLSVNDGNYVRLRKTLQLRLAEPAPAKIQLLVGPRQVGKTTLLLSLADQNPDGSLYANADAPEATLPAWADNIWQRAEDLAVSRSRSLSRSASSTTTTATPATSAILFLDEVQALPDWSAWLKARHDEIVRKKLPLHIVATGSSSLKIGAGSRESMAGRFERLVLTHWGAADLAALRNIPVQAASIEVVTHGAYPGAARFLDDPRRWQSYIRDSIIEPAIGRDIFQLEQVRKPALLKQIFALAAAHPAEILSLEKIVGILAEKGAQETIAHYLSLLHEAFLVAPLQKYAGDEIRRRRSPPKLVVLSNALLAGSRSEPPPASATNATEWGRWLENACLAHFINNDQQLHYWREEPWEIDGLGIGDWGRWLIEIKSGPYGLTDLRGLAQAVARFPDFKPVVLCDPGREGPALAAGFHARAWDAFLQNGLADQ